MAFSATKTGTAVWGDRLVHWGTFDGGGDSGGDINTGLSKCEFMIITPLTTAPTNAGAVAETLPCAGSAVTIANGADVDGYWLAIGY